MDEIAAAALDASLPPQPTEPAAEIQPLTVTELFQAGPMAPIPDPYPIYARARRETPVLEFLPSTSYFVSRYDDVVAVLRAHELFSSRSNTERGIGIVIGRTLIGMDGR